MAELIKSITDLDPKVIVTGKRLRPASPAGVAAVKASIVELGTMKDRIHVRKKKDGKFHLMAGLHRLTAVLELEWHGIPVVAWECTDDWARLMEIDDNLAGAELTPMDTAIFLAERKAVYEKMHPETKHGAKGLNAINDVQTDTVSVWSFAAATAEKFGMSERNVRRLIVAGTALNDADITLFREAGTHVTLKDLQVLATVEPGDRYQVCCALAGGMAKNASEALRQIKAKPGDAVRTDTDKKLRALNDAFARAGKSARRQFVEEHGDALRELLANQDINDEEIPAFSSRTRAAE